jgi:hypothetical protein
MATYFIRRDVSGLEADEVEAAGFRAAGCVYDYPGLRWLRSYWHRERAEVHCYYEAESEAQVREHSERSRMVVSEVREVQDIDPADFVPPAPSTSARAAG